MARREDLDQALRLVLISFRGWLVWWLYIIGMLGSGGGEDFTQDTGKGCCREEGMRTRPGESELVHIMVIALFE